MTRLARRGALLLCIVSPILPGPCPAGPITVMPAWDGTSDASAAARLAVEIALRCPAARHLPFERIAQVLPRFLAGPPVLPASPSEEFQRLRAAFFTSEDALGSAVRFADLAGRLEREPALLLGSPRRRDELRQAYLFSARALQQAGEVDGAERYLERLAARLPDLPGATPGEWGEALAALDGRVRARRPVERHVLVVEGPPGWAVHVDEQALGTPPTRLALAPGPHAVVLVGPDGRRASFSVTLPLPDAQARLIADPALEELCSVDGVAGPCGGARPSRSLPLLPRLLGGEVLVVHEQRGVIRGVRLFLSGPPLAVIAADAAEIERQVCASPPRRPPLLSSARAARKERAATRRSVWPALVLVGAGLAGVLGSIPYFASSGRCADPECTLAYDFSQVAPGLLGSGLALMTGGGVWLGVSLR